MAIPGSSFTDFISSFEQTLRRLFHEEHKIDDLSAQRGLPPEVMQGIMAHNPLSVAIPEQYEGRGSSVKDVLTILSAASYESLPLALTFGINIGLFLGPVSKYANDSVKKEIFSRFLDKKVMGGMMITEPGYGSDALNMKTFNKETENGYRVKGLKHWQGLTGMAEYWLIASRNEYSKGKLGRDIDFFICDVSKERQQIVVEEYFDALGLYMIPYGRNRVDIEVPAAYRLEPETTGIKMMLDILHRSRMQFPGMGMGFIKRMLDEAISHCKKRMVGAGSLLSLDQVSYMLSRIQSAYTMCAAMCVRSSDISGMERNLAADGLEANAIKAVVTDVMQESAQILVQVSGGNGYRISNIGGRGIMDSRPFQIFEGSNEMLYAQIGETLTRLMKKQQQLNLFDFLKGFHLTARSCFLFKTELSFMLQNVLPQRKLHDLGKIVGRVMSMEYVIEIGERGFRNDLVNNCIAMVQQEVAALTSSFRNSSEIKIVEDYSANSSWLQFV